MKKYSQVVSIFVLAILLVGVVFAAVNVMAAPVADVQADVVTGTSTTVNLVSAANLTGTTTTEGTGVNSINYGAADCYFYNDMDVPATTQALTATLQHAVVSGQWITLATFPVATADGTAFTTTVPYGRFMRATLTVSDTTAAITAAVNCVLKNRS